MSDDTSKAFKIRPDLSPFLVHLTKRTGTKATAYENLISILESGNITGSIKFIQGFKAAACFMDIPLSSLKYVLTDACYHLLMQVKADVVVSCGDQMDGVNVLLSKNHQAKSMLVLSAVE